ncbi:MAG: hypothetical protein U9N12_08990 [Euryarchaeota archaeon]|nr:hypothetical protein [Euryarchaeota archaeon]
MDANEPVETSAPEPSRFIKGLVEALDLIRVHHNKPTRGLLDGF